MSDRTHIYLKDLATGQPVEAVLIDAESYYLEVCGMTELGQDPSRENLEYFEMTAAQAATFLE
jgi:hypothetical protein